MSTLTSIKDGSLGAVGPNMAATNDGSLGGGSNMVAFRDGSLGASHENAFKNGSLGFTQSGSYKDGSLGLGGCGCSANGLGADAATGEKVAFFGIGLAGLAVLSFVGYGVYYAATREK